MPAFLAASYTERDDSSYVVKNYTTAQTASEEAKAEGKTDKDPVESEDGAVVLFDDTDYATKVTIANVFSDYSEVFNISWNDNNNSDKLRPSDLSASDFTLMYTTDGGTTWKEVSGEEALAELGLSSAPEAELLSTNKYAYKHLPLITTSGEEVSYKVIPSDIDNYSVSESVNAEQETVFTYSEISDFVIDVKWLDSGKPDNRPDPEEYLKEIEFKRFVTDDDEETLYKYVEGTTVIEHVTVDPETGAPVDYYTASNGEGTPVIKLYVNGSSWSVEVSDLNKYDEENHSYTYYLNQDDQTGYVTSYYNGQGSHGNKTTEAYNGGIIYNRLADTASFEASKVWDDTSSTKRPSTTYTLWRFSYDPSDPSASTDIDANFSNASRVVYYVENEDGSETEVLLSYTVSAETNKDAGDGYKIEFTNETVDSRLPDGDFLPVYDENGYPYVYFVREMIAGDGEAYSETYTDKNGSDIASGASNEGTVTNVMHEKVKVDVNKRWVAASALNTIQSTAQVSVYAPYSDDESEDPEYHLVPVISAEAGNYEKLSGDELDEATTITGFTRDVITGNIEFYVDAYSFDMTRAIIVETGAEDGILTIKDDDGNVTATYKVKSEFISESDEDESDDDALKTYSYSLKNMLYGEKPYYLEKIWHVDEDQYDDIAAVIFRVTGYSESTAERSEVVYEEIMEVPRDVENVADWIQNYTLPAYDEENGYAITYKAHEIGFVLNDGTKTYDVSRFGRHEENLEEGTYVINTPPGTHGNYIHFVKFWEDDGDVPTRLAITMAVYDKAELTAAVEAAAAQAGSAAADLSFNEIVANASITPYTTVTLDSAHIWEEEIYVPNKASEYYCIEQKVGDYAAEYTLGDLAVINSDGTITWKTDSTGNVIAEGETSTDARLVLCQDFGQ